MHIEPCNPEKIEVSKDYGPVNIYYSDVTNIYYVCYLELEGNDEFIPEHFQLIESYSFEEDSAWDEEEMQIIKRLQSLEISNEHSKRAELNEKAMYHLEICGLNVQPDQKIKRSPRFDLEMELIQFNEVAFYEFKNTLQEFIIERINKNKDSKVKSSLDNDVSQLFYETICSNVVLTKSGLWNYEDNKWQKCNEAYSLWNILSNQFIRYLETHPILSSVVPYINSHATRKRIIDDVKNKLFYPEFDSKIDSRKDIIGMKNGTLNLETNQLTEASLTDLISKNTNINYITFDMTSVEISLFKKVIRQVFPDENLFKFFMRSCSTFLEGFNSKKVFYVWWGSGNNCKTGMASLVQSAFGEYCGTAPVSLITSKRSSSAEATPELCHIEGKLVVFLQEPNPKEKLKTGRIKELTGNDKIFVRDLFKPGREMEVKCKIVHVCNFPTASPDTDIAFKRRMLVIKFPSTFLPKDEYEKQKKKGILGENTYIAKDNIEEVLKSFSNLFFYLLVQEYKVFKEVGLQVPEIVHKYTEEFLTYNNISLRFIRQELRHDTEQGLCLSSSDIYDHFKQWFKNKYPSYNIPNYESFVKELHDEGFVEDKNNLIKNVIIANENLYIDLQ